MSTFEENESRRLDLLEREIALKEALLTREVEASEATVRKHADEVDDIHDRRDRQEQREVEHYRRWEEHAARVEAFQERQAVALEEWCKQAKGEP